MSPFCAVFNNNVKHDTRSVLAELKEANIRCGMITGDNLMTAVAVADETGITKSQSIKLRPQIIDQANKGAEPIRQLYFKLEFNFWFFYTQF